MNFFFLVLKNLRKFFFEKNSFFVQINNTKILVKPRSLDLFGVAECYLDKVYEPLFALNKVYTVFDLGAHTGESVLWFAKRFNPKKIIAVEANSDSVKIARCNIVINNLAKKVLLINKAVFSNNTETVGFQKSPLLSIASQVLPQKRGDIKTTTLKNLLSLTKGAVVDYLKIDIEGSEKRILTKENEHIFKNRVRFLSLECHPLLGYSSKKAVTYLKNLGFYTRFQKTSFLDWHVPIIHASNPLFEN